MSINFDIDKLNKKNKFFFIFRDNICVKSKIKENLYIYKYNKYISYIG